MSTSGLLSHARIFRAPKPVLQLLTTQFSDPRTRAFAPRVLPWSPDAANTSRFVSVVLGSFMYPAPENRVNTSPAGDGARVYKNTSRWKSVRCFTSTPRHATTLLGRASASACRVGCSAKKPVTTVSCFAHFLAAMLSNRTLPGGLGGGSRVTPLLRPSDSRQRSVGADTASSAMISTGSKCSSRVISSRRSGPSENWSHTSVPPVASEMAMTDIVTCSVPLRAAGGIRSSHTTTKLLLSSSLSDCTASFFSTDVAFVNNPTTSLSNSFPEATPWSVRNALVSAWAKCATLYPMFTNRPVCTARFCTGKLHETYVSVWLRPT
eukprot:gene9206-biopygen9220